MKSKIVLKVVGQRLSCPICLHSLLHFYRVYGNISVLDKKVEVNLFMKYIRDIYSVQLIQLLADCAEDH